MVWKITTGDNKYQIKYGDNANYANIESDVTYLTITSNKSFGINNAEPSSKYLLDINGITHINSNLHIDGNVHISSNLYTSNIIGYMQHDNSNILQLNNTSTNNYSNNIVKIYGKTSLYGKVNISANYNTITNYTSHLLNIEGSLNATTIYGDGNNITNLNANNISSGTIPIVIGGTGRTGIIQNQLLYGGIGKIEQSENFSIEGTYLNANIKAANITQGNLPVRHGGTGLDNCLEGRIMYGTSEINGSLRTSSDFVFLESTKTLNVSNLVIKNELKFDKLKIRDSISSEYRSILPSDIGIRNATPDIPGLILPSSNFRIGSDNKLYLTPLSGIASEYWDKGLTDETIYFPPESLAYTNANVGINTSRPQHTLDVIGAINTSNGGFYINGVPLIGTSGIETTGIINGLIRSESVAFATNLFQEVDIIEGISYFGVPIPSILSSNQAILSRDDNTTWKIKCNEEGETKRTNEISNTLELEHIIGTGNTKLNRLFITNTTISADNGELFKISTNSGETVIQLLNFTKSGNLQIARNGETPSQKLEVGGNIIATGYVRSYFSDNRLKTLTSNITGALNIIDSLNGFYYVPNEKAIQLGFEYENEIGLSAQEVQKVIPELVKIAPFDTTKINDKITSKSGEEYLTICYERLGAVFVEAIKELRKENKYLKDEIVTIKKDLDNIKKIIYIQ